MKRKGFSKEEINCASETLKSFFNDTDTYQNRLQKLQLVSSNKVNNINKDFLLKKLRMEYVIEITPINKKLAIISGNGDLPFNILESAVSNGWNGVVIDIADNQRELKSQSIWKIYNFKISNIGKFLKNSI